MHGGWSCLIALACALSACHSPLRQTPVAGSAPTTSAKAPVAKISLEDFFVLHQSGELLLIDARTTYYYGLGHIPGASHVPARRRDLTIDSIRPQLKAAIRQGKTIVVYCSSFFCRDAHALAYRISQAGFPVQIFSGGWNEWENSGLPVESASHPPTPSAKPSSP